MREALAHVREALRGASRPWLVATLAAVCLIWGNSLVPGDKSGSLSLAVMEAIHGALGAVGLPSAWITNFLVRKVAHFTEYAVLAILASNALRPGRHTPCAVWVALAVFLVAVPSLDETIQLFVSGRSGQLTDVLLDCCGAATGTALRRLVAGRREGRT